MELLGTVKKDGKSLWQEVLEAGNIHTVSPSKPDGGSRSGNTSEHDLNNGEPSHEIDV